MRKVRPEVTELFREHEALRAPQGNVTHRVVGGLIGGAFGAGFGFVALLLLFGFAFGGAQAGLGAIFLGIPLGGWLGAKMGAKEGGASAIRLSISVDGFWDPGLTVRGFVRLFYAAHWKVPLLTARPHDQ